MRLNFFLQSKDFGGAEQFAFDLITAINKLGHRVTLYTSNSSLLKKLSNKDGIILLETPIYLDFSGNFRGLLKSFFLTPLAFFYYFKILKKIHQSTEKEIILYSGFSEKIVPGLLAKIFKLPIYFIEYGPLDPLFKKLLGIPRILYFLNKNSAAKIIIPSNNTKKALESVFDKTKLTLIPCGTPPARVKKQIKINKKIITVISRLEKGKGQDLAIKAFSLIQKKIKNVELQIIGTGNFYHELKNLADNNKQIKFLNYIANKQQLLAKSTIILCPSVWPLEGFGLTIIEAMAMGKPIIAFDRAPGNELLFNNHNALLAKNGDYLDLAKKTIQLLNNERLQKTLANNAKKDFEKKYEISLVAQKYLNLFKN